MAEMALTPLDNGKSITLKVGESVRISLGENPGTGFRWALQPSDDKVLGLSASDFIQTFETGAGGGGQRVWKFVAQKSGEVRLVVNRLRAWEGDKSTVERFEVTIRVNN